MSTANVFIDIKMNNNNNNENENDDNDETKNERMQVRWTTSPNKMIKLLSDSFVVKQQTTKKINNDDDNDDKNFKQSASTRRIRYPPVKVIDYRLKLEKDLQTLKDRKHSLRRLQ